MTRWSWAVAAGIVLTACQGASSSGVLPAKLPLGASAASPNTLVNSRKPVDVYATLARQIHACWLRPPEPLLPNHNFFAEARPGARSSGEANITVYQKTPDSKKGLRAVSIALTAAGSGTSVSYVNHRLSDALAERTMKDVGRWARGDEACGPAM